MRIQCWSCSLLLAALNQLAAADTIHGVLVDANGAPVARAKVFCSYFNRTAPNGQGFQEMKATSGEDGTFDLGADPQEPSAIDPVRMIVELSNGALVTGIMPVNGGRIVLSGQASFTVHVHDAMNHPIAGASVILDSIDLPFVNSRPSYFGIYPLALQKWTKVSGSTGSVTFDRLPAGVSIRYKVEAKEVAPAYQRLELRGATTADDVLLKRASVIQGRVIREGKPVAGMTVSAIGEDQPGPNARTFGMSSQSSAVTDVNGMYNIADAPSGTVKVSVVLSSKETEWTSKPYDQLQLKEGQELDGLNFLLEKGIEIRGRVLSEEAGKPIAHAQVLVSANHTVDKFVTTGADGSFVARVPAGDIYVAIQQVAGRRMQRQRPTFVTVDEDHNPPIELRVPDLLMFSAIEHLQGNVQNSSGGAAAGASVENLRSREKVAADASGHFELSQTSDPGDLIVAFDQTSMSTKAAEVRDIPNITLALDGKPAIIEGTVVGDDGKPMQGIEVTLNGMTANGFCGFPAATTNADGKYRFDGMYSGMRSFFIWAKKPGYGPVTQQEIVVSSGEDKELPLMTLAPADGTIDGTIFESDGKPAVNASVSAQVVGMQSVQTDEKGHFHLTQIPRGDHWVAAGRNYTFYANAKAHTGDTNVTIKLPTPQQRTAGIVEGNREGHVAPKLKVDKWISGKPLALEDLKGKIVVLDFWAVWCHPCVHDLPKVEALAVKYKNRGVVVIGIHAPGTAPEQIAAFVAKQKLSYSIGLDPVDKSGMGANHVAFGPTGIPHVIVVSPNGHVVSDSNDIDDAEREIEELLSSK